MENNKSKANDPYYKGWFWCSDRRQLFRWEDLMAYYKSQKTKGQFMTIMTPDQNWTDEEWNNFRSEVKDVLVKDLVEVTFTKINGDERVMTCTLQPETLPKVVIKEVACQDFTNLYAW